MTTTHKDGPLLSTGAQVYRAIHERGLHLRNRDGVGRDNTLLVELCKRLGCPDDQLMRFLKHRGTTGEEFLRAFVATTAPFAAMFQDIWTYLADARSPRAEESIRVRFGFEGVTDPVDLEQFRVWVERSRSIDATYEEWNEDAMQGLFKVQTDGAFKMVSKLSVPRHHYRPGEATEFPAVTPSGGELGDVLVRVRDFFDTIARRAVADRRSGEWDRVRSLPSTSWRRAHLLTDWVPFWTHLMLGHGMLEGSVCDGLLAAFRLHVEPHLDAAPRRYDAVIREALDVLDLPFWKDRWRTYEVWATVQTLQSLDGYGIRLRIVEGAARLDGGIGTVIADMTACDGAQSGVVVMQLETPFLRGKRRAIRPDLSVCDKDSMRRAAIVEFKQRASLDLAHVAEVGTAYRDGSPGIGEVVIVNYDDATPALNEDRVSLVRGMRPGRSETIESFAEVLRAGLARVGIRPARKTVAVLLDVSSSMKCAYDSRNAIDGLQQIRAISWACVRRFNDSLLPAGLDSPVTPAKIETAGGTNLAVALKQLRTEEDAVTHLLIVTDGDYGNAGEALSQLKAWKQCKPDDLPNLVDWLAAGG